MSEPAKKMTTRGQLASSADAMRKISQLIIKRSGISIPENKFFLIEGRLQKRVHDLGLASLSQYLKLLNKDSKEMTHCIELMTTHKTEWFREIVHFQWLKKMLPSFVRGGKPLYIWSAASSSGEEIYSLAFFLLKQGLNHSQFKILGTDISRPILDKAINCPRTEEFAYQKRSLFLRVANKIVVERELELALENSIKFRMHNLLDESKIFPIKFNVIFLRNVLIYFERDVVIQVCRNLIKHLEPGGFLVIGLSETLNYDLPELQFIGNSTYCYQPRSFR